jgi:uncharacterized protein with PIN domain
MGTSHRQGEGDEEGLRRAERTDSLAVGQRCDFCGEQVASVRRVALDRDYDRLRTPHRELYACPPCSRRKERKRLGL